jgi:hypothetical protein
MAELPTADALQRLKILIDSSTPIIAMETVEEMRAVRMVRGACVALNLAAFEWSIASGLMRCVGGVGDVVAGGLDFADRYREGNGGPNPAEQNTKASITVASLRKCWRIWRGFRSKLHSSSRTCIATWTTRLWCAACAM